MSAVGPQVHADSAHVVADCFEFMNPDEDDYQHEYILNAIRASGFHRALVQRLPASDGAVHVSHARLLSVMILHGYLHPWNKKGWTYAQIAEDLGGVCLKSLLLQSLQRTTDDLEYWCERLHCLQTILYMTSGLSSSPYFVSRKRFFADPNVRVMLRRDCHPASPCADRRRRFYKNGLFDVLLQRVGKLDYRYNEDCFFVLEMLFATCPESRRAVLTACLPMLAATWICFTSLIRIGGGRWQIIFNTCLQSNPCLFFLVCPRMRTFVATDNASIPAQHCAEMFALNHMHTSRVR